MATAAEIHERAAHQRHQAELDAVLKAADKADRALAKGPVGALDLRAEAGAIAASPLRFPPYAEVDGGSNACCYPRDTDLVGDVVPGTTKTGVVVFNLRAQAAGPLVLHLSGARLGDTVTPSAPLPLRDPAGEVVYARTSRRSANRCSP